MVETTVPASKSSIEVIASLHAVVTQELFRSPSLGKDETATGECSTEPGTSPPEGESSEDFTSVLFSLARVPGVFEHAFRPYRFRISKSPACLICSAVPAPVAGEDLDVALDQALARLGKE